MARAAAATATARVRGVTRAAAALRTPAETARLIAAHTNITLADRHPSGVTDDANAKQNIADTAGGQPAKRSSYENAPGGTVSLSASLLDGILTLAATYKFRVSEIAGGSHSPNSRHYVGVAFDIDRLNNNPVNGSNSSIPAVKQALHDLGATEVLGPGDTGHDTHVHGAWPRP